MMDKLGIPMPEAGMATTVEEAIEIANKIGYPVMVRPSYVLGGRGMEVVWFVLHTFSVDVEWKSYTMTKA